MKKGGSKRKGSLFEREIARKLSLWITNGKKDNVLWRSASSGALATITKNFDSQAGDIAAIDKEGHKLTDICVIEIKHYKDLQLGNLITEDNSILKTFWNKHKKLAAELGKIPLLVAKQNLKKIILIGPRSFENVFSAGLPIVIKTSGMVIFNFDDFLKMFEFREFITYLNEV